MVTSKAYLNKSNFSPVSHVEISEPMQRTRVRISSHVGRPGSRAAVHLRIAGRQPRRAERAGGGRRRRVSARAFRLVFPSSVCGRVSVQQCTSNHRKNDRSRSFQEGFLACKNLRRIGWKAKRDICIIFNHF